MGKSGLSMANQQAAQSQRRLSIYGVVAFGLGLLGVGAMLGVVNPAILLGLSGVFFVGAALDALTVVAAPDESAAVAVGRGAGVQDGVIAGQGEETLRDAQDDVAIPFSSHVENDAAVQIALDQAKTFEAAREGVAAAQIDLAHSTQTMLGLAEANICHSREVPTSLFEHDVSLPEGTFAQEIVVSECG